MLCIKINNKKKVETKIKNVSPLIWICNGIPQTYYEKMISQIIINYHHSEYAFNKRNLPLRENVL